MADELIDIFDENNGPLGIQKIKAEAHKLGLWHRAAHIWIYNSKGELLIQLRSRNKDSNPDMWDISAAGHVSAGEEPEISGIREAGEELGLKIDKKDLQFYRILKRHSFNNNINNNEFYYVYFYKFDGDITKLKLQEEEVAQVKFIFLEELRKELKENPKRYVSHVGYWDEVMNQIKELSKIK